MNLALAPPMTSARGALNSRIERCTSALPVTSMIKSRRGSAMSCFGSVATGISSRRASSRPGAHGFTSAIPRRVTVGSSLNISSRARPPLPAPTMTTLVMRVGRLWRAAPQSEGLGLAPGGSLEGRVLGNEGHLHLAGRPIALLADDDVGDPLAVVGLQPVALGTVEEEDDVGILLEGARLAKVGELGLLALAGFDRSGKLGEGDDGHIDLLGERLEGS